MAISHPTEFATLLTELRQGKKGAADEAFDMVYQELRRLARYYLSRERPNHTLQATALVHEVYLRLFGDAEVEWVDRAHFFRVAGRQMRRILADYGRATRAEKRGGRLARLSLSEAQGFVWQRPEDLLALEEALDISVATLKREWAFAKGFILCQLTGVDLDAKLTDCGR